MKKYLFIFTVLLVFWGCTDDFLETNTNPYEITKASQQQDFNNVGGAFPSIISRIFSGQVAHNLVHDSFVRHLATPTPFTGGINNTTYYVRWNTYWGHVYNRIMNPTLEIMQIAEADGFPVFVEWAKLMRVIGGSRLSAYHGPIIYSNHGSADSDVLYDSEPELYNTFFTQLDEIQAVFNANTDYVGLTKFDPTYGGDINQWLKYVNSLRLQLAIRLTKVDPALAKTQGEKAINDPAGLITANGDNFNVDLLGSQFLPGIISFSWGDTRMSATMESVLGGYNDGRVSKYFDEATDPAVVADHPDFNYKGIRNGALLVAKDDRLSFSNIASDFVPATHRRFYTACETHFNLAEAALRGWAGAGDAQTNYENGVKASFEEWGAAGADAYLADNTSLPWDYNDPKETGDVNDFVNRITNTVAWDEAADNEIKLEKIITQKWISGYMNSVEAWVDHRRTDYPKLPFNYKNDSNSDFGVIAADDFLRRLPFIDNERTGNPNGVADATTKLGGPDEVGTRLWWDTGGPNF